MNFDEIKKATGLEVSTGALNRNHQLLD